ncbi:hypothetical protein [Xenorhabdus bovienii]|uniref:Uncharacterized protein n=1 Tax=Xenorhabdus bovienii str. Intermedium TaxID=1379677 RepID=A0A077QKV8_XENBV|nr:hypothetical protein [Xenorhabdus bovienii]MDE1484301.1 hypothetical protein [Xenorhabdus bovienii]MDE9463303.1 hypothetical protein [Xenorhabdus bovienii]CDH33905.1 hypothetical protein XBI1_2800031 [Xenorhabdus bovienii str. Intermedium]
MKKILQILLLLVIGFAVYMHYETEEIREHIVQLKSKPASQLTTQEKQELAEHEKIEKERQARRIANEKEEKKRKAEEERKAKEYYLAHKDEIDRKKFQTRVFGECDETAQASLKYPKYYEHERSSFSEGRGSNGKSFYYVTITFSGVNAFNVRSERTIQCYGDLNDYDAPIGYYFLN